MINCPNCGADNMVNAIFCRSCGKKLNLDELTPDAFDAPPEPAMTKIARLAQKIITLVLVVGVVGILAGLFWPAGNVISGQLGDPQMQAADAKFKALQTPARKTPKASFTSEEATAVLNRTLGLPGSGTGNKKAEHISVEFLAGGNVRAILKSKLFDQFPMAIEVICRPTVNAPGNVQFEVLKAKAGKLPIPGNLRQNALKQFSAVFQGATAINQAKQNAKSIAIGANSLDVTVNVR